MIKELENTLNKLDIHTNRLSLKKFSMSEVEFNVAHEMQPSLMQFIKDIETEDKIREKTIECAQNWEAKENKWFLISLRLIANNHYIGLLCLRYVSFEDSLVEIGWRLGSEYHGQGLASEGAQRLLDFIKSDLKVHKTIALIDSENQSSIKLAEKLEMEKEAHLKKHFKLNNKWKDELIYSMIFKDND